MATAATDERLPPLFEALDTQLTEGKYKSAVKTADSILKIDAQHAAAKHAKAYALVQSARYAEAAAYLLSDPSVGSQLSLEKAYSLYKSGDLAGALAVLNDSSSAAEMNEEAAQQLRAQLLYRSGREGEAIDVYESIRLDRKDNSAELQTNLVAAYVAAGRAAEVDGAMKALKVTPQTAAYEVAYNHACALIELARFTEAATALDLAIKRGTETLFEEGLDDDEVEAELLLLRAQQAYVRMCTAQHAAAQEAYDALLSKRGTDELADAVIATNSTVLRFASLSDQPPKRAVQDGLKRIDALVDQGSAARLTATLELKLSKQQKCAVLCNRAALLLHAGQTASCKALVAELLKTFADAEMVHLLNAAVLVKEGKSDAAESKLAQFCDACAQQQRACGSAWLLRAQLAASASRLNDAAMLLQSVPDEELRYSGGVVVSAVTLAEAAGNMEAAEQLLQAALAWWERRDGEAAVRARTWCLQRLASIHSARDRPSEALACYTRLREMGDGSGDAVVDMESRCTLARALAHLDAAAAARLADDLPAVPTGHVDVEEIETRVITAALSRERLLTATTAAAAMDIDGKPAASGDVAKSSKRKRKRKPRYPKGFDPANPGPMPDPERWLPKWERAEFRKRRKRRERQNPGKGGTQGAGKVDEKLDRAMKTEDSAAPKLPARGLSASRGGKKKRR